MKYIIRHSSLAVWLVLHCFAFCVYGQNDARAQKIIDDLAAKFKTYPSVSIDFSATVTQLQDQSESTSKGIIQLKGSKYKLEVSEYVIYFDGLKVYQYLPDVKEVNVSRPEVDENDEEFQFLNPQAYFNLSSKKFKSDLAKESTQDGRKVYEINLYPIQVKTSKYSRIHLSVEKTTLQIVNLKVFLKDGTQYTLSFKSYNIMQTALPDSFFSFDEKKHPGVEVIDLTF